MAPFYDSRPINCPTKRDTRTRHVELDSDLLREIYLHEIGAWDLHLVAETIDEAREYFSGLSRINDITLVSTTVTKLQVYHEILKGVFKDTRTIAKIKGITDMILEMTSKVLRDMMRDICQNFKTYMGNCSKNKIIIIIQGYVVFGPHPFKGPRDTDSEKVVSTFF